MKKLVIALAVLMISLIEISGQIPKVFSYQAVVRDQAGNEIANQDVNLKISILTGSVEGAPVYIETNSIQTNQFGLINLQIGNGTKVSGDFEIIDWGNYSYFLKVEMDETGGTDYKHMGTTQLLSVPYALYAEKAGNVDDADADPQNELITNISLDGTILTIVESDEKTVDLASIKDGTGTDDQDLILTGDLLSIENGTGSVDLSQYIDEDTDTTNELQNLSLNGNELSISKGNFVILSGTTDSDADSTNELQVISISDDTIYLTNGGFVKLPAEYDPVWSSAITNYYTKSDMQTEGQSQMHWGNIASKPTSLTGYGITDAMSTSHEANNITAANISNWDNAYSWGNHSGLYRLVSYVPSWNEITSNPFTFTSTTADQIIKYNGATSKWENWTPTFLTTEVDGSVTNELQNLESVLSQGYSAGSYPLSDVTTISCRDINIAGDYSQNVLRLKNAARLAIYNSQDDLVCKIQGNSDGYDEVDVCTSGMIWWDIDSWASPMMGLYGYANDATFYVLGKVGIGTGTPNYTLDVRGTIGNNTTLYHSDIQWKKDITNILDPIDKVMRLQGVYFNWRSEDYPEMKFDEKTHLGFIAQDVEKVIPEVVRTDQNGFKNIEYTNLIPLLLEAIKDQQKKIEELEKLIKE
jgi:hypothetical protein